MLWVIAAVACLVGVLGIGMAVGTRLRVASLEQELAYWHGVGADPSGKGAQSSQASRQPSELAH